MVGMAADLVLGDQAVGGDFRSCKWGGLGECFSCCEFGGEGLGYG
jgi:hypothetical protein